MTEITLHCVTTLYPDRQRIESLAISNVILMLDTDYLRLNHKPYASLHVDLSIACDLPDWQYLPVIRI